MKAYYACPLCGELVEFHRLIESSCNGMVYRRGPCCWKDANASKWRAYPVAQDIDIAEASFTGERIAAALETIAHELTRIGGHVVPKASEAELVQSMAEGIAQVKTEGLREKLAQEEADSERAMDLRDERIRRAECALEFARHKIRSLTRQLAEARGEW